MDKPIIEFTSVRKVYGENVVLADLSFSVRRGEKIALIGPSGSGKTTILRTLMTLESIDAGLIRVDGDDLWNKTNANVEPVDEKHLRNMRTKLGMVFQQFNLFPHMTVLENIVLPQVLTQAKARAAAVDVAHNLLNMVGLSDKASAMPGRLSGGQKQRVAIARALALEPKIMLFDEVTSALDPELVDEVQSVIRKIGQETDMTMLLVTHEMNFARELSDRVLFFDKGKIVEEGNPENIFRSPKEERTRLFLQKIVAAGHSI